MSHTLIISERGQITLPVSVRKKYSLGGNTPLVLEERPEGLILRKASLIPLQTYSMEEIQGWLQQDKILPKDKKWIKAKSSS